MTDDGGLSVEGEVPDFEVPFIEQPRLRGLSGLQRPLLEHERALSLGVCSINLVELQSENAKLLCHHLQALKDSLLELLLVGQPVHIGFFILCSSVSSVCLEVLEVSTSANGPEVLACLQSPLKHRVLLREPLQPGMEQEPLHLRLVEATHVLELQP